MRNILLLEFILFLAAVLTGGLVLLLGLALASVTGWPVSYALIAAAAAALFAWIVWSSRAAEILEHLSGADQRKPTRPAKDKAPKEINLRIHAETPGGFLEGVFLDRLPICEANLVELAHLVVNGQSLTTSAMTGSGISRATWEILRDRLLSAGLLAWRPGSRSQGCQVTSRGMAVFRRMAAHTPPPTPPPGRIR
jgi:hypothetical protein